MAAPDAADGHLVPDLTIPEAIGKGLSLYPMRATGFKGGAAGTKPARSRALRRRGAQNREKSCPSLTMTSISAGVPLPVASMAPATAWRKAPGASTRVASTPSARATSV